MALRTSNSRVAAVADFHNKWYVNTVDALSNTADQIAGMIAIGIPVKKKNRWWLDLLTTVASTAINLIPFVGPEVSLIVKTSVEIGRGLLAGAPAAVVKTLPAGDPQARQDRLINDLTNALNGATDVSLFTLLAQTISTSLAFLQGNEDNSLADNTYQAFVDFTADGKLSDSSKSLADAGLVGSVQRTQQQLQTYVISEALKSDEWHILMLPSVDPVAVAADTANRCPRWTGDHCPNKDHGNIGCDGQLNELGMCNYLWYSPGLKSSFTLLKASGTKANEVRDKLTALLQAGYINGVDFFEGAALCILQRLFKPEERPILGTYGVSAEWGFFFFASVDPPPPENVLQTQGEVVDEATAAAQEGRNRFIAINARDPRRDNAFVWLSMQTASHDGFKHPENQVFTVDSRGGTTLGCSSMLDLEVGNSWGGDDIGRWTIWKDANDRPPPPLQQ